MDGSRRRVAVWQPGFTRIQRRRSWLIRLIRAFFIGSALGLGIAAVIWYFKLSVDLGLILDVSVILLPIVLASYQWISPVTSQTREHRIVVSFASVFFSALILWQQSASRKAHKDEMSPLATKRIFLPPWRWHERSLNCKPKNPHRLAMVIHPSTRLLLLPLFLSPLLQM